MSPRWEYLVFVMEHRTELKTRPQLVSAMAFPPVKEQYWDNTTTYLIFRPGAEDPERIEGTSSDASETGAGGRRLLNKLGAEGWELVSDVITNSTVSKFWGWPGASSFPIRREWTLRRAVEER